MESTVDFKNVLKAIQEQQVKSFYSLNVFKEFLATKRRGMYWIWTKLSWDELEQIQTKELTKEVPIAELVRMRQKLNNICTIKNGDYRIVYNGIGGYRTESKSFGLRERINQELNCNNERTGTLNIKNRNPETVSCDARQWESQWAVSFFDFDEQGSADILASHGFGTDSYNQYAHDLELSWRIEFGVPILNRI
ncbi:hypothetical protein [Spirochaeta africana]|uniref:Uncharacterized protein n=1 Tax=Spirochaeta africana (strain ATCC 700263 / DSM 8902 / Z-7692) TaxID=889378 RepID=H9UHH6_SPIAZ|nr:hypothetical protein [Spirochaeta africana]AFG36969.1 hypothetical protein Spiaf_0878 [Spirochaeta africana DSM 8902]